jgi:hypothetical protein
MLIRGILLFSFFVLQAKYLLFAQDTSFYLRGKVIDEKSHIPVANALVKICGSYHGTATDSKGFFSINAKKNDEVIEIKAYGYSPYYISTPVLISPENVFRLKRFNSNLSETLSAAEKLFSNSNWDLRHYTFWNDKIIVMASNTYSNRDAILSINFSGQIENIKFVVDKLTGFANTSDGFIVACGESFAYPLVQSESGISINTLDLISFEKKYYSSPFKDSTGKYFRYQSGYDFYLSPDDEVMVRRSYTSYHVRMKKYNRLALFKNYNDEKFSDAAGNLKNAKEIAKGKQFLLSRGNVIFHEVPWQIIQARNQLLFIDRDNLRAEIFDTTGKLIKSVNYKVGLRNGITHKFIYDEKKQKFYCCVLGESDDEGLNKLNTFVSEINFETGKLASKVKLSPSVYESIQVNEGKLFFLTEEVGCRSLETLNLD